MDRRPYPAVTRWLAAFEALPDLLPLRTDGATGAMTFDAYFTPRG